MKKLLTIVLYIACISAYAQLPEKISVSFSDTPLKVVFTTLHQQYGIRFSYSKDLVQLDKKITLTDTDVLANVLKKIFQQANVECQIMSDQVVVRGTSSLATFIKIVKGKVLDHSTNTPLPFASVRIAGTSLGTATNTDGVFVLHVPAEHLQKDIVISFIGYVNQSFQIETAPQNVIVRMEENSVQLQAVTITTATGLSILQEAIARIQDNYDTAAVRYTYFTRDISMLDDEPVGASETLYQAYRNSLRQPSHKQIKALKGRRIKDFAGIQKILQTFIRWTGFEMGLGSDIIFTADLYAQNRDDEFPGPVFLKQHQFELLGTSRQDGRDVYLVAFDQKDAYRNKSLYKGKFYIDTESLAFTRIEMALSPKGIRHAKFFGTSRAMATLFGYGKCAVAGSESITTYKSWNGKWYPASMNVTWDATLVKPKAELATTFHLQGDVVITDIETNHPAPFAEQEVLSSRDQRNWEYFYTLSFWDSYNTISPDAQMEDAYKTIMGKNKRNGMDTRFWKRYQPYKSNPSLLKRDSAQCHTGIVSQRYTVDTSQSLDDQQHMAPRYPALNKTFTSPHFIIHYLDHDSISAQQISAVLEKNYERVIHDFNFKKLNSITQVELYPSVEHYHFAIGKPDAPDSDAGMAVDHSLFKMVSPGNPGTYHTRESLLKAAVHEFAHCVHYTFMDGLPEKEKDILADNPPALWLFEAIASYEAGQYYAVNRFDYLRQGQFPSLHTLNDVEENGKVYDVGYVLIDFIRKKWGPSGLHTLLQTNGNIAVSLGLPEQEFEKSFHNYLRENLN